MKKLKHIAFFKAEFNRETLGFYSQLIHGQPCYSFGFGFFIVSWFPEGYVDADPMPDDSVKFCPDCETPNQFGELCGSCERDFQEAI